MKKFITLVAIVFVALTLNAQNTGLGLGDINMHATTADFISLLKSKGFSETNVTDEDYGKVYGLKGKIASYSNCNLSVVVNKNNNSEITGLMVAFPKHTTWESLSNNYITVKDQLTQQCGNPFVDLSYFNGDPLFDMEKLKAVESSQCTFASVFVYDSYLILSDITYTEEYGNHVELVYASSDFFAQYLGNDFVETLKSTPSHSTEIPYPSPTQKKFSKSKEHLKFKGIPIDGTLTDLTNKLKAKGLTYIATEDGIAMFEGDFAGYKGCWIGVVSDKSTNLAYGVAVLFKEQGNWNFLYNNYAEIKEFLTAKYGQPTECIEEFEGYQPTTDSDKLFKLQMDNCKYITEFVTPEGIIELSLYKLDNLDCCVFLIYKDGINSEAIDRQTLDDL